MFVFITVITAWCDILLLGRDVTIATVQAILSCVAMSTDAFCTMTSYATRYSYIFTSPYFS